MDFFLAFFLDIWIVEKMKKKPSDRSCCRLRSSQKQIKHCLKQMLFCNERNQILFEIICAATSYGSIILVTFESIYLYTHFCYTKTVVNNPIKVYISWKNSLFFSSTPGARWFLAIFHQNSPDWLPGMHDQSTYHSS